MTGGSRGEGPGVGDRPPLLARLLLRLIPRAHREVVTGDLEEEYATTVRPRQGRLAAGLWFWRQAFWSLVATAWGHWREDPAVRRDALRDGGAGGGPSVHVGRGPPGPSALFHDLAHAARSFRSGRSALVLAALVLAVAIGAGTTTYSVVSGVVLRSLPFAAPDRLVMVRVAPRARRNEYRSGATMSWETVGLVMDAPGAFEDAAYYYGSGQPVLTGVGEPARVTAWTVGPGFFQVLGTPPLLGRVLVDGDQEATGGTSVAVLSHRFWLSRFGGDPGVIGRTLRLDDWLYQVVGVMPPGFEMPGYATDVWLPEVEAPAVYHTVGGYVQGPYWLIGRLRPGLSREAAMARMDPRFDAYARDYPDFTEWGANLQPLQETVVGAMREPLLMLLGAVALVLLVACANVATVLLARGVARRREVAVRLSLGAGRLRVARQLLAEAVLLALAGGAAGVALAAAGVPAAVRLAGSELPRAGEIGVDWRIVGVAVLASVLTGLLTGALPAFQAARASLSKALKEGSTGAGTSSWASRTGEALVVLQVALGTVLLAGASLLIVTFYNLTHVEPGFEPSRVVVAQVTLPGDRYGSAGAPGRFYARLEERLRGLPEVEAVAASSGIPFDGGALGTPEVADGTTPEGAPWAWYTHVTADFFRALGLPVVKGRLPSPAGGTDASGEVVVNQAFVRSYFPDRDPLGTDILYYDGANRGHIVGVVGDARQESLEAPPPPHIYIPMTAPGRRLDVVVRTALRGGAGPAALRDALRELDPTLPIDRVGTLDDLASESVARQRFYAVVLWGFAVVALLITALGVYGVTAYSVSRRTPEIGIRMALGASGGQIRSVTLGHAALLAGGGVLLGLAGATAVSRVLEAMLFGISPTEPLLLGAVAAALGAVALLAAWPPAVRASRLDPMGVLRTE